MISEHCVSCDAGSYQNQSGQSSCNYCEAGYYSGKGMPSCSRCTPEEYSLNDGTGCQVCVDTSECPCMLNSTCFTQDNCLNLGGGSYTCGSCPAGYDGDGVTCTDIDEVLI